MEMPSQRTMTRKEMPVNPIPYSLTTKYDGAVHTDARDISYGTKELFSSCPSHIRAITAYTLNKVSIPLIFPILFNPDSILFNPNSITSSQPISSSKARNH